MTKSFHHLLLGAALTLALVLAACSGGGDPESTPGSAAAGGNTGGSEASATAASGGTSRSDVSVTSDDGALTVTVPAGAGPADITVTSIDAPAEFADLESVSVLAAYELGPDGAEFSEPVTLEFRLPVTADAGVLPLLLPVISNADKSGFELLDDIVVRTGDDGEITLSAAASHFSSVTFVQSGGGFRLTPEPLRMHLGEVGNFVLDGSKSECPNCILMLNHLVVARGELTISTTVGSFSPMSQSPPITCVNEGGATVVLEGSASSNFVDAILTLGTGGTVSYGLTFTATVDCVEEGPISLSLDALTMVFADRVVGGGPQRVDEAAPTVTVTAFGVELTDNGVAFSGTFEQAGDGSGTILVEVNLGDGSVADWFLRLDRQSDGSIDAFAESVFYGLDNNTIGLRPDISGVLDDGFRVELPLEFDGGVFYAPLVAADGELLDPARIQIDGLFFTFTVGDDGAAWGLAVEPLIEALRR